MDNLRHQKCKNKPLNNTRVLKVNNSTLELERDFKPINISINDMGKFGKKKRTTNKRTFTKNCCYDWYDWLINYTPESIKKPWVVLKTKL